MKSDMINTLAAALVATSIALSNAHAQNALDPSIQKYQQYNFSNDARNILFNENTRDAYRYGCGLDYRSHLYKLLRAIYIDRNSEDVKDNIKWAANYAKKEMEDGHIDASRYNTCIIVISSIVSKKGDDAVQPKGSATPAPSANTSRPDKNHALKGTDTPGELDEADIFDDPDLSKVSWSAADPAYRYSVLKQWREAREQAEKKQYREASSCIRLKKKGAGMFDTTVTNKCSFMVSFTFCTVSAGRTGAFNCDNGDRGADFVGPAQTQAIMGAGVPEQSDPWNLYVHACEFPAIPQINKADPTVGSCR